MTLQSNFNKGFHGKIPKGLKVKDDDKPALKKTKKKVFK
tara:strand:- start:1622 stop:1738 length:117 start_codon:yes stop_codon:yes gene_type:complete